MVIILGVVKVGRYFIFHRLFFADDILSSRQISDWSKHKKAPNIIVTSRITFLGYPRNIFANIFAFCFFTQNARDKGIEAAN